MPEHKHIMQLLLFEAVKSGNVDRVRQILDAGADVKAQDQDGFTVLMHAAFGGHLDVVRVLLAAGGRIPSARDRNHFFYK